jgi:hypothetical protein
MNKSQFDISIEYETEEIEPKNGYRQYKQTGYSTITVQVQGKEKEDYIFESLEDGRGYRLTVFCKESK